MKKIFLMLTLILSVMTTGCGDVNEEGRLYTMDDIFIDCIKITEPDGFHEIIVIEDDEALKSAVIEFPKLDGMPGFEEIQKNYPIDEHIYVVKYARTDYESETITCDGIMIDKENGRLKFKIDRHKKKHDTFDSLAGYIMYAVFPKEELDGCDFSEQPYVRYPGRQKPVLTLETVKELAKKGDNLAWSDFERYESENVSSVPYVMRYEVGEEHYLLIGDRPVTTPRYIYLVSKEDESERIDIRTDDIDSFLARN